MGGKSSATSTRSKYGFSVWYVLPLEIVQLMGFIVLRWLQQRSWHDQLREDCIMCSQLIGLGLKMLERGAH
jgi:hypothetical protein